jgi:hypothetical protein
MTWYNIIVETPGYEDYEVGEEYAALPDEVIEDYSDYFEEVDDDYTVGHTSNSFD